MLKINSLSLGYSGKSILDKLCLEVSLTGTVTGLLGPNGAGKSSLFKCITGFERSYSGEIYIEQHQLDPLSPSKRTLLGLGYMPQESWVFNDMSVEDNLHIFCELQGQNKKHAVNDVSKVLDDMGISHLKKQLAKKLSGGEKRRLEFARTLLLKPKVLLLDEPFTGIDPKTVQEITKIITDLKNQGLSIIISDHQAETILGLADFVYVQFAGKFITGATPDEIRQDQRVKEIYLGFNHS